MDETVEAVVSIAQTAMRVRGQWVNNPAFRSDVRAMVHAVANLLNLDTDEFTRVVSAARAELELKMPA